MRVLLVEDEQPVRDLLTEILRDAGLDVRECASAEAALAREEPPPLVLVTDINLGSGMSGLELAAAARRRWRGLRVVFITGQPWRLNLHALRGTERFLAKPFGAREFLKVVSEAAESCA